MTNNLRPIGSAPVVARMLILVLIVTLAIPITALTEPGEPRLSSWAESAVAAKGKKQKTRKNRKPRTTTVTRSVRGPVTRTVANAEPITIPARAPATNGPANPYPSAMVVTGFANGVITDVDLVLQDFTHDDPGQVDILLVKDDGRRALVMSDAAKVVASVTNIDLTLDDEAAVSLPELGPVDSGVFRPANFGGGPDTFAAPAPTPDGNVALSTFDGANPNGTWRLFVMDDDGLLDVGDIRGWALRITAEADLATVDEQVPGGKDTKKARKKRRHGKR